MPTTEGFPRKYWETITTNICTQIGTGDQPDHDYLTRIEVWPPNLGNSPLA